MLPPGLPDTRAVTCAIARRCTLQGNHQGGTAVDDAVSRELVRVLAPAAIEAATRAAEELGQEQQGPNKVVTSAGLSRLPVAFEIECPMVHSCPGH